jgi:hypothetical protein
LFFHAIMSEMQQMSGVEKIMFQPQKELNNEILFQMNEPQDLLIGNSDESKSFLKPINHVFEKYLKLSKKNKNKFRKGCMRFNKLIWNLFKTTNVIVFSYQLKVDNFFSVKSIIPKRFVQSFYNF